MTKNEIVETLNDEQFNAVMHVVNPSNTVEHSDGKAKTEEEIDAILATLTDEQLDAVKSILSEPNEETQKEEKKDNEDKEPKEEEKPNEEPEKDPKESEETDPKEETTEEESEEMTTHNIFENKKGTDDIIQHSDEEIATIFADAKDRGSLKDSLIEHGINKIEELFPEATNVTPGGIQALHDTLTATDQILGGISKFPKGHIKVRYANLGQTQGEVVESLRAKGYIKGNFKKEQAFGLLSRSTNTTTIYKKQGIDRDDLIDLDDFNVVDFYWKEMRMMLNEEIARAVLIGDGRPAVGTDGNPNPDKIDATQLKPIATDDDFYTIKKTYSNPGDLIEKIIRIRKEMLGRGNRSLYISVGLLDDLTLIKDTTGRFIWDEDSLRRQLKVSSIVETSLLPEGSAILGNLNDYTISANKGGQIFTADDFDLDYNKYKYLIETRIGGMITTPKAFAYFTPASNPNPTNPVAPSPAPDPADSAPKEEPGQ